MAAAVRTQVMRGEVGGARWELARRPLPAALSPYVAALQGYLEHAAGPVARREPAGLHVVIILEFEPRLRVFEPGPSTRHACYPGGFIAGLDDQFSLTEHAGFQAGIQINLHPVGARQLLGMPLRELRGQAIAFGDLLPEQRHLSEELAELRNWDARLERVERFLLQHLGGASPASDPAVSWALQRLAADGGKVGLAALAAELGYSHKHLIARFHDQVGVPPKLWARLLRFERVRRELARAGSPRSWAELALACGYYDQAHLARDIKQFTGGSPRDLLASKAFVEPSSPERTR